MAGTENIVETQIATHSKDKARKLVIDVFEMLSGIKDNVPAEAILRGFQSSLTDLANKAKREDKGGEEILGEYIKGGTIVKADKSPVSRVVDKILKEQNVSYSARNFVNTKGTEVNPELERYYKDKIAMVLHKCKKLKSADVLIAMHFLTRECQDLAVLRLQILRGMFDELSKPNGFIKGGPDNQNENGDSEKDKRNKHLGLLATARVRKAAKIACESLARLMKSAEWLRKEDPKWLLEQHNELPPKTENGVNDQPKTDRARAIRMQQDKNIKERYLRENDNERKALPDDLKPRGKDEGKYRNRKMASDEQLTAFLKHSGSVIRFIDLKNCTNDDAKFKQALDNTYKIDGEDVSLREILNKLADIVYTKNTLIEVVKQLPDNPDGLDSLLTLVEEKLKRSQNKNENRVKLNKELSDWVTIISVVNACTNKVTMKYDPNNSYDNVLANVVTTLKGINIKVVADDGTKLENKTIAATVTTPIAYGKLKPLGAEHKKRLSSLDIEYNTEVNYGDTYKKICAFIETPNENNLKAAKIEKAKNDGEKKITETNWTKSKTFDDFVNGDGKDLKNIVEVHNGQPTLPPLNGETRKGILVLSTEERASAGVDATKQWFDTPTWGTCETAKKDLAPADYLGEHNELLLALTGRADKENKKYVLGIQRGAFVASWIGEAGKTLANLTQDTNYVQTTEGAVMLNTTNKLKVCAKIGGPGQGYGIDLVNAFVDFVTKNSNADFCGVDGIKNTAWGNLMNGTHSLLVDADPQEKKLSIDETNHFKLDDKKNEEVVDVEHNEPPEEEKKENEQK